MGLFKTAFGNQKGETLIGSLMAAVILLIIISSVPEFFARVLFINSDKTKLLETLIAENVMEVEAKSITAIPRPPSCRLKTYSITGKYISTGNCPSNLNNLNPSYVYVIWDVIPQSGISATFSHSSSMKLPTVAQDLYQVNLIGKAFKKVNDPNPITRNVSVFKR